MLGILGSIAEAAAKRIAINAALDAVGKTVDIVSDYKEKHKHSYVWAPMSAGDYVSKNYREVRDELSAYGFENIILLKKEDVVKKWFARFKDGEVEAVSINGKSNFKKKAKFAPDARVVITYHCFKKS